jgi:hypothetical protein
LLEAVHSKEAEADQRASTLWGELVEAHREWDVAEKDSSMVTKMAVANQQREAAEEQCGSLTQ